MNKDLIIKITATVLLIAITAAGILFGVNQVSLAQYRKKGVNISRTFTITAHTGCMGTEDNTTESIEKGVDNGADIVEFDLYCNKDGILVLAHDEPVGNEITLDEAFRYISTFSDVAVNVDIKTAKNLEQVYETARKYKLENRIFYTGVKDEFVEPVREQSPNVPYYLNVDVDKKMATDKEYLLSLVKKVKDAGAVGINFNYKNATKELVDVFRENDLLVSVWTVDKELDMYKILEMSPDNITTRNPDKLYEIVKKNS